MNFKRLSVLAPMVLGVVASSGFLGKAAAESHDFVIAANDGYGVQECLAEAGPCGQVVADAWCEAHGLGRALRYGSRSAVLGGRPINVASTDEAYIITCGE